MTWLLAPSPGAQGSGGLRAATGNRGGEGGCPEWLSCSDVPRACPVLTSGHSYDSLAGSICVTKSTPSKPPSDSDSPTGAVSAGRAGRGSLDLLGCGLGAGRCRALRAGTEEQRGREGGNRDPPPWRWLQRSLCRVGGSPTPRQHPGQGGGAEGTRHLRGQQDPRTAIFLSCTDPQEPVGCINAQMRCKTYPKGGLSLEGESAGPCLPTPCSTSWYLSNIQTILGFQNDAISVPV